MGQQAALQRLIDDPARPRDVPREATPLETVRMCRDQIDDRIDDLRFLRVASAVAGELVEQRLTMHTRDSTAAGQTGTVFSPRHAPRNGAPQLG